MAIWNQKKCTRCRVNDAAPNASRPSGFGSWCSSCTAEGAKKRRDAAPGLLVERACSKCRTVGPMRVGQSWCKRCQRDAARVRRAVEPDYTREQNLLSRYGLTLAQYEEKLTAQDGVCACCGNPPKEGSILHVDHDHSCCPGKKTCGLCLRDLLCIGCNLVVGKIEAGTFVNHEAYIMKWREASVHEQQH